MHILQSSDGGSGGGDHDIPSVLHVSKQPLACARTQCITGDPKERQRDRERQEEDTEESKSWCGAVICEECVHHVAQCKADGKKDQRRLRSGKRHHSLASHPYTVPRDFLSPSIVQHARALAPMTMWYRTRTRIHIHTRTTHWLTRSCVASSLLRSYRAPQTVCVSARVHTHPTHFHMHHTRWQGGCSP